MSATAPTTDRVELTRYTLTTLEERVLYGWRTGPTFLLTDAPATGDGREYVIERQVESLDEVRAIVLDYVLQAQCARFPFPPADIRSLYPELAS